MGITKRRKASQHAEIAERRGDPVTGKILRADKSFQESRKKAHSLATRNAKQTDPVPVQGDDTGDTGDTGDTSQTDKKPESD